MHGFNINPFPPIGPRWDSLAKIFYFNLRSGRQKISYERRDYESVDEKSLS